MKSRRTKVSRRYRNKKRGTKKMKAGIHPNRNQMNLESLQLKRNPSINETVFLHHCAMRNQHHLCTFKTPAKRAVMSEQGVETKSPRSNKYNNTKTPIDLLNMYSLPNQSPVKITDQRQ